MALQIAPTTPVFVQPVGPVSPATVTPLSIGTLIAPATTAENATAVAVTQPWYEIGNVLRYGIVPNTASAAAANATILKTLFNPAITNGPTGTFIFPNTTGADIYYVGDLIALRDGVVIDLQGTTIQFVKVGVTADSQCGFFHAIRNVTIQNGFINVNYTYTAGTNTGNAIGLGGRGTDVALFPPIYDSLLASPMGNITLRNLDITSNAGGGEARAIFALGGLTNVVMDNINIDGQGVNLNGLYAEFGWATNESSEYLRQTSHPNNWHVTNLNVQNMVNEGFAMNGGYGITIDGIRVYNASGVVFFGPGEALFYRPWSNEDGAGAKRNIYVRNAVGGNISNLGFAFGGSSTLAGMNASYLGGPSHNNPNGLTNANLVDLLEFTLENFSAVGTANNYGVEATGARATIRGGTLVGFQRGVVISQECTNYSVEQVEVFNSTSFGVSLGQAINTVYSPARQATGRVRTCFIAGSGTVSASAAIVVGTTISCVIENNRFGYEVIHDGIAETTQLQAVSAATDAFGVHVRNNYVGGVSTGTAYAEASGGTSRNNRLENNSGIQSAQGSWITDWTSGSAQVIASSGTIAITNLKYIRVAPAAAVTGVILAPGTAIATDPAQEVVVINESIAASSVTMAASGTSNVANGVSCVIPGLTVRRFVWDAATALWYQQT
jgi:hypothetical protein